MSWLPFAKAGRLFLASLGKAPDPNSLAWAIAMGVAVGLVPKGNLLAVGLGVAMCSIRLNLIVALSVAVGVSCVAASADPLFDRLGFAVLTLTPLHDAFVWIASQPFASWLQFNNTVVMGAFLVAVVQIYPTLRLTRAGAAKAIPPLVAWLATTRLIRFWKRLEWSARLSHAIEG